MIRRWHVQSMHAILACEMRWARVTHCAKSLNWDVTLAIILAIRRNSSGPLFFWLLTASGRSQAIGCGVWVGQPEAAQPTLHTKEASHRRWRGDLRSYRHKHVYC